MRDGWRRTTDRRRTTTVPYARPLLKYGRLKTYFQCSLFTEHDVMLRRGALATATEPGRLRVGVIRADRRATTGGMAWDAANTWRRVGGHLQSLRDVTVIRPHPVPVPCTPTLSPWRRGVYGYATECWTTTDACVHVWWRPTSHVPSHQRLSVPLLRALPILRRHRPRRIDCSTRQPAVHHPGTHHVALGR